MKTKEEKAESARKSAGKWYAANRERLSEEYAKKKRFREERLHAFWQVAQVRWLGKRTKKQQVQDALEQTAWRNNWTEKHLKTT